MEHNNKRKRNNILFDDEALEDVHQIQEDGEKEELPSFTEQEQRSNLERFLELNKCLHNESEIESDEHVIQSEEESDDSDDEKSIEGFVEPDDKELSEVSDAEEDRKREALEFVHYKRKKSKKKQIVLSDDDNDN